MKYYMSIYTVSLPKIVKHSLPRPYIDYFPHFTVDVMTENLEKHTRGILRSEKQFLYRQVYFCSSFFSEGSRQ